MACWGDKFDKLLKTFPLFFINPCLFQDSGQEIPADIALMWIRNSQSKIAFDHELVLATGIRTIESEPL